jgi:putative transposase
VDEAQLILGPLRGRYKSGRGPCHHFNGRLLDECLNVEVFFALIDVRDKLERWRQDYNQVCSHSSLRDSAPALFAAQWAKTAAPGPEPVPAPAGKPAMGEILEILN